MASTAGMRLRRDLHSVATQDRGNCSHKDDPQEIDFVRSASRAHLLEHLHAEGAGAGDDLGVVEA
eukprot:4054796-Pleurochrysis_carterae.AAC.1